ncbi:MAG: GWxTD domain-containing protein [Candidatus Neomarinimicrobiota bacterium]
MTALVTMLPILAEQSSRSRLSDDTQRGDKKLRLALEVSQFPTADPDSALLWIYAQIKMSQLVFVRHDDAFRAAYEVSVFALDEEEKVRATFIWLEEVILEDFQETKSTESVENPSISLALLPGDYEIMVHITDLDNRRRYSASEEVTVKRYPDDQLTLGDILLVSKPNVKSVRPEDIIPQIGGQIADDVDSFYVYMVIRNPLGETVEATYSYTLSDSEDEIVASDTSIVQLGPAITAHLIPIATSLLLEREYSLEVGVSVQELQASETFPVTLEWTGISSLVKDIEKAIEQTRYLARRKEMKKMQAAETDEERLKLFTKFWEERDPSPGTPRNELMDEYYRRVAYANTQFKTYQEGWMSDLGMVFIIYGPPDDIERHPFDAQRKPYQIWQYYEKGWRFVFVDVNMFGDYRLVTPLYPTGR